MVVGLGFVASPAAHASTQCTAGFQDTTIHDNLVIPAGVYCSIERVTVYGNITGQPGSSLAMAASTVNGSVSLQQPKEVWIGVGCGVRVPGGDFSDCPDNNHFANSVISGSLTVSGATGSSAYDSGLCGTNISGSVLISGGSGSWKIGGQSPKGTCFNPGGAHLNTFGGSVTVSGVTGRVDIGSNSIGSSVTATNNTGGGSVTNNTIRGSLNVSNDTPCWTVSGNTAASKYTPSAC